MPDTGTRTVQIDLADTRVKATVLITAVLMVVGGMCSLGGILWGVYSYSDGRWNEGARQRAELDKRLEIVTAENAASMKQLNATLASLNTSVASLQNSITSQTAQEAAGRAEMSRNLERLAVRVTSVENYQNSTWADRWTRSNMKLLLVLIGKDNAAKGFVVPDLDQIPSPPPIKPN